MEAQYQQLTLLSRLILPSKGNACSYTLVSPVDQFIHSLLRLQRWQFPPSLDLMVRIQVKKICILSKWNTIFHHNARVANVSPGCCVSHSANQVAANRWSDSFKISCAYCAYWTSSFWHELVYKTLFTTFNKKNVTFMKWNYNVKIWFIKGYVHKRVQYEV